MSWYDEMGRLLREDRATVQTLIALCSECMYAESNLASAHAYVQNTPGADEFTIIADDAERRYNEERHRLCL